MKPEIIPATEEHISHIAANVREADRVEFAAIMRTAEQVLKSGLQISTKVWTGTVDSVPICMFGVAPVSMLIPEHGRAWMVGTHDLDKYSILFLRRCRPQVKEMLDLYPVLSNYVAASNVKAIEWLKWLGFKVSDEPILCGIGKVPFLYFERRSA